MSETISQRIGRYFTYAILILCLLLFINRACEHVDFTYKTYFVSNCTTEAIQFESQTTYDNTIAQGESYTAAEGILGARTICKDGYGKVKSDKIIKQPVDEQLVTGTYIKPIYRLDSPNTQYYEYQNGAMCNDGTHSDSTGRGTCSRHDGVDYYL